MESVSTAASAAAAAAGQKRQREEESGESTVLTGSVMGYSLTLVKTDEEEAMDVEDDDD